MRVNLYNQVSQPVFLATSIPHGFQRRHLVENLMHLMHPMHPMHPPCGIAYRAASDEPGSADCDDSDSVSVSSEVSGEGSVGGTLGSHVEQRASECMSRSG